MAVAVAMAGASPTLTDGMAKVSLGVRGETPTKLNRGLAIHPVVVAAAAAVVALAAMVVTPEAMRATPRTGAVVAVAARLAVRAETLQSLSAARPRRQVVVAAVAVAAAVVVGPKETMAAVAAVAVEDRAVRGLAAQGPAEMAVRAVALRYEDWL